MEELPSTFDWVSNVNIDEFNAAIGAAEDLPIRAIGSGGSLSAAHALAQLHQEITGQIGIVATPHEVGAAPIPAMSNWLLSAGGNNVDIVSAAQRLIAQEPRQLAVLCGKPGSRLMRLTARHQFVDKLTMRLPTPKDGFLATNSLFGFALLMARAYLSRFETEETWEQVQAAVGDFLPGGSKAADWERSMQPLWERGTTVVLHDTSSKVGAIDLESKFTEAAIGNLQIADYRNFAHGRHHWFAKRGGDSSILAFFSPPSASLAKRTLTHIPEGIPVARVDLGGGPVEAMIKSLLAAIQIAGLAGKARDIDPGRPGVPEFGRKLYRLSLGKVKVSSRGDFSPREAMAIERKSGLTLDQIERRGKLPDWSNAMRAYTRKLEAAKFGAIVFDYDGTLVDTRRRFDGLSTEIAEQLSRLLFAGLKIGVATGRGRSVGVDLRNALPEALWAAVTVGYYNGADIAPLSDIDAPDGAHEARGELADISKALRQHEALKHFKGQSDRPLQITLEAGTGISSDKLWEIVQGIIRVGDGSGPRATRSSHSIDIVAATVSKANVFEQIRHDGELLAIGDKGRWPGNDFALLQAPYSLSVDEVNSDTTNCWNLGRPGERGLQVTLDYLTALNMKDGLAQFSPEAFA